MALLSPSVSFIIPLYNGERYITRCLDSLLSQGLPDDSVEIIVVDNGSKDNGAAIVRDYAAEHGCVRLLREDTSGVCNARNTGILNATGDYLLLIDQDDILYPDMIRQCIDVMDREGADVLKFGIRFVSDSQIDEIAAINTAKCALDPFVTMSGVEYLKMSQLVGMGHSQVGTCLIRNAFRHASGALFDPSLHYYEDQAFIIDLMLCADKVLFNDQPLYCFLSHPDSTSHDRSIEAQRYILDGILDWPLLFTRWSQCAKVKSDPELSGIVEAACHARCYGAIAKMIALRYDKSKIKEYISKYTECGLYPYHDIPSDSCYRIHSMVHAVLWHLCKYPTMVYALACVSRRMK